ncbi:MAG TPA: aminotransferase class V-fold PLP-dependent enzyme [Pirellulales bacterium]|nr:aminotransferase class V-fold PLP-dependent enzyme [Pirellulales bacterium]
MNRIYLDNAATTWPKPPAVYEAVELHLRNLGASAGRSLYDEALRAAEAVRRAREGVGRLLNADSRQIVFAHNGTDALNLALHGLLDEHGGRVVTSVAEHNSVLRPLRFLEQRQRIDITRVGVDASGVVDLDAMRSVLASGNVRLVAITHASNVTGAIQPVDQIIAMAHEVGALVLIDAAQTLGELPIDARQLGVDLLAAPGHKGLLGPLGTGVLYLRPGVERQLAPQRQGGTGSASDSDVQPTELPEMFESGSLNVPAIAGLGAGINYLRERGVARVRAATVGLCERLLDGLRGIANVRIYGPPDAASRTGIVSITLDGCDPHELASMLETTYRIQARAGLHCAGAMHAVLGTSPTGGTLRFSLGPFTTEGDLDATIVAMREIAHALNTR